MKLPACRGFNLLPDTLGRQLPMLDFSGVEGESFVAIIYTVAGEDLGETYQHAH